MISGITQTSTHAFSHVFCLRHVKRETTAVVLTQSLMSHPHDLCCNTGKHAFCPVFCVLHVMGETTAAVVTQSLTSHAQDLCCNAGKNTFCRVYCLSHVIKGTAAEENNKEQSAPVGVGYGRP